MRARRPKSPAAAWARPAVFSCRKLLSPSDSVAEQRELRGGVAGQIGITDVSQPSPRKFVRTNQC